MEYYFLLELCEYSGGTQMTIDLISPAKCENNIEKKQLKDAFLNSIAEHDF